MSTLSHVETYAETVTDTQWRELYTAGGVASIVLTIIPILAVIAYFIWPYAPGVKTTSEIFGMVQNDPFGALMALDFFVLLGGLISVLILLALYISLKSINEAYAFIALVLGLLSVAAIIAGRPIAEIFVLSDQYTAAATDTARGYYLAAGEALLPTFHGTAWMVYAVGMSISYLLSAFLMLRSTIFSKATAYVGIATNVFIGLFFVPVIGPLFMFIGTIVGVIWSVQLASGFFRLARRKVPA